MNNERAKLMADAVEDFVRNPPPDVVERLKQARDEAHRRHCPLCGVFTRRDGTCPRIIPTSLDGQPEEHL